ncbi:MAG TPA: NAD(P)H-dependent oxidoreductase subunit E [Candidatus Binataceae bacterium]|jgi:NADH-quinone oxidoreductase E subunit|nr:NAD(P)H-dependent oxidoreductase subunit E [Candidatus Binataceae bacterium]
MPDGAELKFSDAALAEYHETLTHYPTRQAALLPTLWIAQREFGWLSPEAMMYVATLMELPPSHVRGVVTFYTMFYQQPVGKWHLEVCTNLSCRLRGADQIVDTIKDKLGIDVGQTTADKKFTLSRAECLASCGTAPMLQLNHDSFYENLTPESTLKLLDELASRGD